MLTTVITGAVAAVCALFGVKPGPYLVWVWIAVKLVIALGLYGLLNKFLNRSAPGKQAPAVVENPPIE